MKSTATKPGVTVAEALGQIVWLLSQSPIYRELRVRDVENAFLPAILARQFRIFRMGEGALSVASQQGELTAKFASGLETTPLGAAVWGQLSENAEARLEAGEKLSREDWTSGNRTWLIELVMPFATAENRLQEIAMLDLLHGPLKGLEVRLHQNDPATAQRRTIVLPRPSA